MGTITELEALKVNRWHMGQRRDAGRFLDKPGALEKYLDAAPGQYNVWDVLHTTNWNAKLTIGWFLHGQRQIPEKWDWK